VTMYFPPAGGGGTPRPLKIARFLPELGVETHVLAPSDPKRLHRDDSLADPPGAVVHRIPNMGPGVHRPAAELSAARGAARLARLAGLTFRRMLVPDPGVVWTLGAMVPAIRIVRRHGIDVVVTSSPPASVNLVGAAVKRVTGAAWVPDLRDSIVSLAHRRKDVRGERALARLIAARADAIVAVSEPIAEEMRALGPRGRVVTIEHGADFDDFDGLEHHPSERFRITHTGTIFGRRDPKPFLEALARSSHDVVARFVGDFRPEDAAFAKRLGLGDRLELRPYVPRREALALQRDSEALLLLVPRSDGRGRFVISTKVFEYLAAGRPVLAAVPEDGAAAAVVRETGAGLVVPPDDPAGIAEGIAELERRWRAGTLGDVRLEPEVEARVSRRGRVAELAEVLESVA